MTSQISLARQSPPAFDRSQDYDFDFNPPWTGPSNQNGTRPRSTFRTGTLAGAYRATSYGSMGADDAPQGTMASPRRTRDNTRSRSDASNPPEELLNNYKRIEEDGTLAEYVSMDGWETKAEARPASRLSQPSSARERNYGLGLQDRIISPEGSLLEGHIGASSPRRRTGDYTRDEQRLKRVTGGHSPVFSKAKIGARAALTADNLQRREDEIQHEQASDEGSEGRRHSLNLPSTWGSRAAHRQGWLRNVSGGSHETKDDRNTIGNLADPVKPAEPEAAARPAYSSRPFERRSGPIQSALESSTNRPMETQDLMDNQANGVQPHPPADDGAPIPNTPIVVFKNSTFAKPSPLKRDSQNLLRKLSRTESPKLDQVKTPDPPKLFERKIYDKTPRVTGAWIDTPMTERVSQPPTNLHEDVAPPPAVPSEKETSTLQEEPSWNTRAVPEPDRSNAGENAATDAIPEPQHTQSSRPPLTRPKLPRSALETVIEDVNSGRESLALGDDTIESLQAIIDDPVELKSEEEEDEAYEQEVLKSLQHTKSEDQDFVDYDRLGDKLHSLTKNINEVKRGLTSLEEHVQNGSAESRPTAPLQPPVKIAHLHDGETCKTCHVQSDGRVYAAIPLPRLWTRHAASGRLQLTALGWLTLVSLSWYVIECLMWERYSQPSVADSCNGYCVQPDAPDFPWVTVTMLWRWSHLSMLLTPITTIATISFRFMKQLLGLSDGFVDEPPSLGNLIGEIRVNGTSISFPWLSSLSGSSAIPAHAPPQQPPQQPPPPVWTPRFEASQEEPIRWAEDQPSMDDDEYL
ncbi:hypothetical protein N7492_008349 [Penicillium capsulatum]|uniref:Uncharacterized protein n=1 Tax=Penicillium capsulatum TaxID=69766 RepID=A0A9W9LFU9_9EURO|nr:hypothetical protein N7492_008349 [Penicillium capsulatum]KAJ6105752.1 hypothetical protein N7512_009269 [Penicillium capsulatum]